MKKLFSIAILITLFFLSGHAFATDTAVPISGATNTPTNTGTYTLLAPIGNLKAVLNTTDIGSYFNIFFKLIIGLCAAMAVVVIIFNGIKYMGEDSIFGKGEAKSGITAAILGLFIALGSYALLNTINPALLGGNGLSVDQASITLDPDVPQAAPSTGTNYPNTTFTPDAAWPSDADVRATLAASNININAANCATTNQHGCTSVYQLNTSVVTRIKNDCGCAIKITGGTEFWLHNVSTKKIHYPGGWTVDLVGIDAALANYIHSGTSTKLSWGTCYVLPDGLAVVDEGNHFHTFSTSGGCVASAQGN